MIELPILPEPRPAGSWSDPAAWHLFTADGRTFAYVADGSRVYELNEGARAGLECSDGDDAQVRLSSLGIPVRNYVTDEPLQSPQAMSLSLAVAQKCNLACTYCYAQGGSFGGRAKAMPRETACQAVDFLLAQVLPGERVNISFLGGEPLTARNVLRQTVQYAVTQAAARGVRVGFSLTTNGTLVTSDDAQFLARHGFAVTVSLDGVGLSHDRLRFRKDGSGTFNSIVEKIRPLIDRQGPMQVSARVTVTPQNLDLTHTLTEFVSMGFHSVGFAPMLASPQGTHELDVGELEKMLEQMITCGRIFEDRTRRGERFPFSNLTNALTEIHRGTHRPYPCGAGAGYLGVSADGDFAACHRFVETAAGVMGSLRDGIDRDRQNRWLSGRHVHRQEPCSSCWARYLCGGGCHHEVLARGRPACHYIRGWLNYCLEAYARLTTWSPGFFDLTP